MEHHQSAAGAYLVRALLAFDVTSLVSGMEGLRDQRDPFDNIAAAVEKIFCLSQGFATVRLRLGPVAAKTTPTCSPQAFPSTTRTGGWTAGDPRHTFTGEAGRCDDRSIGSARQGAAVLGIRWRRRNRAAGLFHQSTHSNVPNSTSSRLRHGPFLLMSSVLQS